MEKTIPIAPIERQKLIRCQVTNGGGKASYRVIELEHFSLWEYLVTNKHGLTVSDPHLCLWISEEEYQENIDIYSRAGEINQVNRISVELFDGMYGFTNTIQRFVPDVDTKEVVDIISSRVPRHLFDSNSCEVGVVKGRAIEKQRHTYTHLYTDTQLMILGLES